MEFWIDFRVLKSAAKKLKVAVSSSNRYIDFHLHTNQSDGSDSPERVVERAHECGLAAIAITDHDTLSGVPTARASASKLGIDLFNGIEISALYGKIEVHILGLGVALDCSSLNEALAEQREHRDRRIDQMLDKLNGLDVTLSRDDLDMPTDGGSPGRMHLAKAIVAAGKAKTVQGAFDKYIKAGRPAYVPKSMVTCERAIELIHDAGGLAFIAHPGIGTNSRKLLPKLLHLSFDGLEAYHSRHSPGQIEEFLALADENGLLVTGGSDCHGTVKGQAPLMGKVRVPYSCYERMLDRIA